MKRKNKVMFLVILCSCILMATPVKAKADSIISPPDKIEIDEEFILLGWPGGLPEKLNVRWEPSESSGVVGYNIYEVIEGEDGAKEYVKMGSVSGEKCSYQIQDKVLNGVHGIFGMHRFVVTAVSSDGQESDYSEIATSGIYYHLGINCSGITDTSIAIQWDELEFAEADSYEIRYRTDDYEYWQYYDTDGIYTDGKISYNIIEEIKGDVRRYTITGLQPDTDYVISVWAYCNGEFLDRSDYMQIKTERASEPEPVYMTVSFDPNGGICTETEKKVKEGLPYGMLPTPVREGYTFEGWYTAKEDGSRITKDTVVNLAADQTLYAHWSGKASDKVPTISVKRVALQKPVNKSAGKMKITWKKVSGADGYQVIYAANKNFRNAKKKIVTKKTLTVKKLKKGKTYYVKVRAYKLDAAGEKVYGTYSKVKKVKITK